MARKKTSEAQIRASMKWTASHMHRIPLDVRNEYYEEVLKPAAKRAGEPMNTFIKNAIADRIARESAQEAAAPGEAITTFVKAHVRSYTVTYRVAEQFPSGDVKASPTDAQKVVEASSEEEARVAFFRFVRDQMQAEVAFEESDKLGVKREDGVIEICKIVSVE